MKALAGKKFLVMESPIGRRQCGVSTGFSQDWARIVGVVRDVAESDLTDAAAPVRYVPYSSVGFMVPGQTLVFRVADGRDPLAMLDPVRAAVLRAAPRVAIQQATTMERVLALAVGPARQVLSLVSTLTVLALVLGAIRGIYGVMSHFVARRKRDWGILHRPRHAPFARAWRRGAPGGRARGVRDRRRTCCHCGARQVSHADHIRCGTPRSRGAERSDSRASLSVGVLATLIPALRASGTDPAIVLREQ